MAKIVCVLYEDPVTGYPRTYARDDIPDIERYPGGQTTPTPKSIDFRPGQLLGSVSGELGLRKFLESQGHPRIGGGGAVQDHVGAPANRLTAEASIGNGGEERGGHHDYCNIRAALSGARRRSLRD